MVTCRLCKQKKSVDDFYKADIRKSGDVGRCKECAKKSVRANREKNLDYYREFDRNRANLPHRVEARKSYQKTEKGREAASRAKAKWREGNSVRAGASAMVGRAVRNGLIEKPSCCSSCAKSGVRLEAHHDDYLKPLDVRWLCSQCHRDWHKDNGPGING